MYKNDLIISGIFRFDKILLFGIPLILITVFFIYDTWLKHPANIILISGNKIYSGKKTYMFVKIVNRKNKPLKNVKISCYRIKKQALWTEKKQLFFTGKTDINGICKPSIFVKTYPKNQKFLIEIVAHLAGKKLKLRKNFKIIPFFKPSFEFKYSPERKTITITSATLKLNSSFPVNLEALYKNKTFFKKSLIYSKNFTIQIPILEYMHEVTLMITSDYFHFIKKLKFNDYKKPYLSINLPRHFLMPFETINGTVKLVDFLGNPLKNQKLNLKLEGEKQENVKFELKTESLNSNKNGFVKFKLTIKPKLKKRFSFPFTLIATAPELNLKSSIKLICSSSPFKFNFTLTSPFLRTNTPGYLKAEIKAETGEPGQNINIKYKNGTFLTDTKGIAYIPLLFKQPGKKLINLEIRYRDFYAIKNFLVNVKDLPIITYDPTKFIAGNTVEFRCYFNEPMYIGLFENGVLIDLATKREDSTGVSSLNIKLPSILNNTCILAWTKDFKNIVTGYRLLRVPGMTDSLNAIPFVFKSSIFDTKNKVLKFERTAVKILISVIFAYILLWPLISIVLTINYVVRNKSLKKFLTLHKASQFRALTGTLFCSYLLIFVLEVCISEYKSSLPQQVLLFLKTFEIFLLGNILYFGTRLKKFNIHQNIKFSFAIYGFILQIFLLVLFINFFAYFPNNSPIFKYVFILTTFISPFVFIIAISAHSHLISNFPVFTGKTIRFSAFALIIYIFTTVELFPAFIENIPSYKILDNKKCPFSTLIFMKKDIILPSPTKLLISKKSTDVVPMFYKVFNISDIFSIETYISNHTSKFLKLLIEYKNKFTSFSEYKGIISDSTGFIYFPINYRFNQKKGNLLFRHAIQIHLNESHTSFTEEPIILLGNSLGVINISGCLSKTFFENIRCDNLLYLKLKLYKNLCDWLKDEFKFQYLNVEQCKTEELIDRYLVLKALNNSKCQKIKNFIKAEMVFRNLPDSKDYLAKFIFAFQKEKILNSKTTQAIELLSSRLEIKSLNLYELIKIYLCLQDTMFKQASKIKKLIRLKLHRIVTRSSKQNRCFLQNLLSNLSIKPYNFNLPAGEPTMTQDIRLRLLNNVFKILNNHLENKAINFLLRHAGIFYEEGFLSYFIIKAYKRLNIAKSLTPHSFEYLIGNSYKSKLSLKSKIYDLSDTFYANFKSGAKKFKSLRINVSRPLFIKLTLYYSTKKQFLSKTFIKEIQAKSGNTYKITWKLKPDFKIQNPLITCYPPAGMFIKELYLNKNKIHINNPLKVKIYNSIESTNLIILEFVLQARKFLQTKGPICSFIDVTKNIKYYLNANTTFKLIPAKTNPPKIIKEHKKVHPTLPSTPLKNKFDKKIKIEKEDGDLI